MLANLPALPMGTIVTAIMFIGLLFATRLPGLNILQRLPLLLRQIVGSIVIIAGMWNVFWHAVRHLTEFWGIAALISGLLMILVGIYIVRVEWLPNALNRLMPVALFLLLACACFYAWTIVNL